MFQNLDLPTVYIFDDGKWWLVFHDKGTGVSFYDPQMAYAPPSSALFKRPEPASV